MSRPTKLTRNGHLALACAVPAAVFLAASLAGSGGWQPVHTWLTAAVAVFAGSAMCCYTLASATTARGESPRVSHPVSHPRPYAVEQAK